MTDVVVFARRSLGWDPIHSLARLAASMLEGSLTTVSRSRRSGAAARIAGTLRTFRPRDARRPGTLYIANSPHDIANYAREDWFPRTGRFQGIWIIDSFWTEGLPRRWAMPRFDMVGYTQHVDAETYAGRFGDRAIHLGWGTDALDMGCARADRDFDVMRFGRQPPGWEDDARTARIARDAGVSFHGRPPYLVSDDPLARHAALMRDWLSRAKLVLAHTNLGDPSRHVHQVKEYYTARWTDALAAGATVAGRAPRSDPGLIDWPEALIDLPGRDAGPEMATLRAAVDGWTPERAVTNHLGALRRLDWRWRIAEVARRFDLGTGTLDAEMARLRAAIDHLERGRLATG